MWPRTGAKAAAVARPVAAFPVPAKVIPEEMEIRPGTTPISTAIRQWLPNGRAVVATFTVETSRLSKAHPPLLPRLPLDQFTPGARRQWLRMCRIGLTTHLRITAGY